MRTIIKILPFIILSACGTNDETIKKRILQKKNQIARIEQQIADLKKQLSDTTDSKRLVPVQVKEIKEETFNHYLISYGNVEADKYAMISPEMAGRIEIIHVNVGDYVSKGQLLVSLNTDAVNKQISALKSSFELASTTFKKLDTLWKQGIGSEIEYLSSKSTKENLEAQLESLHAQKRMSQIRAPFNGIVDKIFPKKGELASPMFPVIEFVNLTHLIIKAEISEKYIGKVHKGDKVELTFSSLPGYKKEFPINRISKVIDSKNRTFEIELRISNPGEIIKPNMVSTIRIKDFSSDMAFVIPSLVIRKDITGNYLYVVTQKEGESIVSKKYVTTSLSYDDQTMISKGLSSGDKVIIKGFHLVSSGVPVKVVE